MIYKTRKCYLLCALGLLTVALKATAQNPQDSLLAVYDSLELSGVTVVAAKPMVKMEADKMSYDVEADTDSQSATVLDMLRKVPMVTVDGQDNISVNGSTAFKVYVDGKPNPMFSQNASQIFKMMPASAVSKIEVITNPGARYDAEGAVGVLNIVMAKQPGGTTQSLDGAIGTLRAEVGTKSAGGGIFASARQGKLSATASMMHRYQHINGLKINTDRDDMSQRLDLRQRAPFTMGSVNVAYDADSLNTLSASVGITAFDAKAKGRMETTLQPSTRFGYDHYSRMKSTAVNVSADWIHYFTAEHDRTLTISYLLQNSPQTQESTLSNFTTTAEDQHMSNKPKSQEHTLQIDYTTPIAQGQTLSIGTKAIMRRSKSDADNFHHSDDIAAAYAEHVAHIGQLTSKAGLRYEHTWQRATLHTDYGTLVPSASLSYAPKPTQNIGLTYNMRISRPGISYLNPYVNRSNPEEISYGNPHLDVAKTHNVGLSFSSFTPKLMVNTALHQELSGNQIEEYKFYHDRIVNTTFGNILNSRKTSATLFLNWLAAKDTRLMLNGSITYAHMHTTEDAPYSAIARQKNHGWEPNIMLGMQQTLPWQLKLSANAIAGGRTYTLQGHTTGFQIAVISLTKSFIGDRLNVTLTGISPLGHGGKLKVYTSTLGTNFHQQQSISVPLQQVQLNLSYTFGNSRLQTKQHRSRIENDFTEKKSDQELNQLKINN